MQGNVSSKKAGRPARSAGVGETGVGAQVIRAQRIPEQVAAQIRKRVLRGEIREGDVLPPEPELVAQLGISRPTLREALRILEAEQFIVVRRGGIGGAVVQRPNLDLAARQFSFVLQDRGVTLADVHRARALIEPAALSALAFSITPAQLEELHRLLAAALPLIGDSDRYSHAIESIRERMVEMTGAVTVALLMRMLREVVARHTAASGRIAPERWAKLQKLSLKAHQRLVELVAAGDQAGAEAFWREHLAEVAHHLGSVATTRVIDVFD